MAYGVIVARSVVQIRYSCVMSNGVYAALEPSGHGIPPSESAAALPALRMRDGDAALAAPGIPYARDLLTLSASYLPKSL
jgi:hypothetical protein